MYGSVYMSEAVLPTLWFSREFGLVFFEDLRVACFRACFHCNVIAFWDFFADFCFADSFFLIYGTFAVSIYC